MHDAKLNVLAAHGKHRVKKEQNKKRLKAQGSPLDMAGLGVRMATRRDDLLARST